MLALIQYKYNLKYIISMKSIANVYVYENQNRHCIN